MGKVGHAMESNGLCFCEIVCGYYCLYVDLYLVFYVFVRDVYDTKFPHELSDVSFP